MNVVDGLCREAGIGDRVRYGHYDPVSATVIGEDKERDELMLP